MAQAKMYQVDYLSGKVREAFKEHEDILEQQIRIEENDFVQSKQDEIAKKLGADKIKKALADAEEQLQKAQDQAKDFIRTFANKHRLTDTLDYKLRGLGSGERVKAHDIDDQVKDFARKYATTYMKKSKAMKEREKLRQLRTNCQDAIKLTNDIEDAQVKVENILKAKAPFMLEHYAPNVALLEAPKRVEEEL